MAATSSPSFARDAIEACLDRITASPHFARSLRLGRFLRFTVEALFDGRVHELKERTIGIEVYERRASFDPRVDPIVRSEAHRLRSRLTAYYAREGVFDPIVIALPKGSYVPVLRANEDATAQRPRACGLTVADLHHRGAAGPRARALGDALRTALARWPGLQVLPRSEVAPSDAAPLEAAYRVEGVLEDEEPSTLTARIVRLADGVEVWSETVRVPREPAAGTELGVAERLAISIGASLTRRTGSGQPAGSRAHDPYVTARHDAIEYGNTLQPRHLEAARRRLEDALARAPDDVDALAELAHLELLRLYPPRGETTGIVTAARALLERALAVAPHHARSLYLLGHVEGAELRPREALRLTESAVAIDPDDPEGQTMRAVRYTSLGFWESALVACEWAVALDAVWDASHRIQAYLLTRMGRLGASRRMIDELARRGTSPPEVAMARFDLAVAEGDLPGARAVLESAESLFALRPDLEDRREIAQALGDALAGRTTEARRTLAARRHDGPRFWDHAIRLALALGESTLALELLEANAINRSYRWLASEPLVRTCLHDPGWRALADALHDQWLRDLAAVGPRLPAAPAPLPDPAELRRSVG